MHACEFNYELVFRNRLIRTELPGTVFQRVPQFKILEKGERLLKSN